MENKYCIHNRKNSCIAHKNSDPNLVSHPSKLLFDTSMSFHLAPELNQRNPESWTLLDLALWCLATNLNLEPTFTKMP